MTEDTTPIYKQALIEAKKVRELAKREAEKTILSKFSVQIDKMLDAEISGVPLLLEQEDPMNLLPDTALGTAAANPQMPATAPLDATPVPPVGDMGTAALTPPTTPSVSGLDAAPVAQDPTQVPVPTPSVGAELGIPIPGPDGKITVDIETLFAATPEGSEPNLAAATITPVTPTDVPTVEMPPAGTPDSLGMAPPAPTGAEAAPGTEEPVVVPNPITESFKSSLRTLGKEVRGYKKSGVGKEILQNKIFTLYEIAKTARENKEIPENTIVVAEAVMELMFQELKKTDKQVNSYKTNNIKEESEMAKKSLQSLEEFARSLFEEVEPKGHAGFGDGDSVKPGVTNTTTLKDETPMKKSGDAGGVEDPGKEKSLNLAESEDPQLEAELMEMLNSMGSDESDVSVKKEALEKQLSALKEQEEKLKKELQECGMMGDASAAPVNVNLKITVDKEGEVSDVKLDGGDEVPPAISTSGEEEEDMDLEIVPDEDESPEGLSVDGDDEEEEKDEVIAESKVAKENKVLRARLAEQQFLSATSIYTAKLFAEHNLSTGAKQKIVKYFDSAQNLQEAKARYGRVKKMLEEGSKPAPRVGSSSKPAQNGGAFLSENAATGMNLQLNPNRWMQLAGITKKSE
jgi:hypothetical protein